MLWNNEFVGLALDRDRIRMAHIKKQGNTIQLIRLDSFELAEKVTNDSSGDGTVIFDSSPTKEDGSESRSGDVFGFEESSKSSSSSEDVNESDMDFEDLEAQAESSDSKLDSLDMVSESGEEISSNPVLLYDIITDINSKSVQLGLNIPSGETIFQVIRDTDFREVKTKDLIQDLESKLESIYSQPKSSDNYSYDIREDGSLILASVEKESPLLSIANETKDIYNGKMDIRAIYPDEVALVGLLKSNYQLKPSNITALVQFAPDQCRIVFMKGEQILQVMPAINQGTESSNFLNTVFSKLLFQLDTGKIPGIDQIILANNTLGEESVQFFQKNFADINVQEFEYNDEKFDAGKYTDNALRSFTNAIAVAWAASETNEDEIPALSFLPSYVQERQKIFKLQWHGLLLLLLIFLSIPTINYFYQRNAVKMDSLNSDLELTKAQIAQVEPIVEATNEISQNLTLLTSKLTVLDSLSKGSKEWSSKLDILNRGMNRVPNSWFTSLSRTQDGTFIEGYTLYRNRVPVIVDLFAEATLLNVTIEQIREEEIYRFSMMVQEFTGDTTLYSPEKPQSIQQILNN